MIVSDKKEKKLTYAMTVSGAEKHVNEANKNFNRALMLIEMYSCSDYDLRYKDNAISTLAEYMTNMKFYEDFMRDQMLTGDRIKNKKTGEDTIVVAMEDFTIINGYLITTAACENELETLGISMRLH
tara:strand:+ start:482 stop:862 length:381 start_codon:yes stop_codon:yes gene_type:complete